MFLEDVIGLFEMAFVLTECMEFAVFHILLKQVAKLFLTVFLESTEDRALKPELAIIFCFDTLDRHLFEFISVSLSDNDLI